MKTFQTYATNFEVFPAQSEAFDHLKPFIQNLKRVSFIHTVKNPLANQGQLSSNFDEAFNAALMGVGGRETPWILPKKIRQKHDFSIDLGGRIVVAEIEKSNREKILRDLLKCHMYLHYGAAFTMIVLPKNFPHKISVWNLFSFGMDRYRECEKYGFGTQDFLRKTLLVGFDQHLTADNRLLSVETRREMREAK